MLLFGRFILTPRIVNICIVIIVCCWLSRSYAEESPQLDTVYLQLRWHHQFQFAGYYAAIEKGYYADEGLNVHLRSGDPTRQPVGEVLSGNAQYAEGNSEILYHRLKGQPLVALAAIFQHSPSVLISLKSSGIRSVHDLIGKKVMLANRDEDADFLTMFLNEDIPISMVDIIPSSYQLDDLISGKVDAFNSYITNEPYYLKSKNIEYNLIEPGTYRIDFYSDILFTSEAELKNHPQRVEAMRRATLKGWQYAMDHPEEIIELLKTKYQVAKTRDHLRFEAAEIRKLIIPDLVQIGHMNPERWKHMADTFVKAGLVNNDNNFNGFLYDYRSDRIPRWVLPTLFFAVAITLLTFVIMFFMHRFNRRMAVAQKTLLQSEERFKALSEATYGGLLIHDKRNILECNDGLSTMTGFGYHELIGMECLKIISEKDVKTVVRHIEEGYTGVDEVTGIRKDGSQFPMTIKGKNVVYKGGQARVIELIDITQRKKIEDQLKLAASVFTHAREGIIITDHRGKIIDVNTTFSHITGYSREEVLGRNPRFLKSSQHDHEYYLAIWESLREKKQWFGELWNKRKNGELFAELITISAVCGTGGEVLNYVALFSDITPMKEYQQQLEYIAHYDPLTNLPNRILLSERLNKEIEKCDKRGLLLAVAYLDLDGFKVINDSFGHNVGDDLLRILSNRMNQSLRDGDTLARIGGDEFVAVLVGIDKISDCCSVLDSLLQAAMAPVLVGERTLQVSTSIGVTLYPHDGVDPEQLVRHADQAMYIAKQMGKNRYHTFDVHRDKSIQTQRETIEHIQHGLDQQEFVLHYQPKVNMRTGEVVGVEALIRWNHPERGLLHPAEFLPIIENHPVSVAIGEWVLNTALSQMVEWQNLGYDLSMSINVDAFQLQQRSFITTLSSALNRYPQILPSKLQLEVLETSALGDMTEVLDIMKCCIDLGVSFALDDFGTGFSSLTYLKRLPVAQLKIDQSFIRDMLDDADDRAIVIGVISLTSAFNRQVIAEGVETIEHGTKLLAMGCELAQGYGIARPMPAEHIPGWLTQWAPYQAWIEAR